MYRTLLTAFISIILISGVNAQSSTQDNIQGNNPNYIASTLTWLDEYEHPIVIELFTSTLCPECAPAGLTLFNLSQHKNVIALGCHIDYIERTANIPDLGIEECTNRQWFFKSSRWTGEAELSIPQFVINGDQKLSGSDLRDDLFKIKSEYKNNQSMMWAGLSLLGPDTLSIELPDAQNNSEIDSGKSHGVWLIRYSDSEIVKIPSRIENTAPQIVRFTNVVKDIHHAGRWYGKARKIDVDLSAFEKEKLENKGGWVVVVQKMNSDEILIAGKIKDQ